MKLSKIKLYITIAVVALALILTMTILNQISYIYNIKYNLVFSLIKNMKTVEIIDSWRHEDTTLEDFGFKVRDHNGSEFFLNFYEGKNWFIIFFKADGIVIEDIDNKKTVIMSNAELLYDGIDASSVKKAINSLTLILKLSEKQDDSSNELLSNYIYFSK